MGIVLGIPNILSLNPKRLQRILDMKHQEKIENFNMNMGFAWEIGRLVRVAVNSPNEYPKRPTSYKEPNSPQSKEENIRNWAAYVERKKAKQ